MHRILRSSFILLALCLLAACGGSADVSAPDGILATVLSDPPPQFPTATAGTAVASDTATVTPTETLPSPTATATATVTPSPTPVEPTPTMSPISSGSGDDRPVIVLDPGHDRMFPSALGIEYQVNLRTALVAREALEAAGYQVYLTRETNEFAFLDDPTLLPPNGDDFPRGFSHAYAHATKALQFEPDMVIALHYNGHPDPNVARLEVYYCENGGPQNLAFAEMVRDELVVALNSIGFDPPSTLIGEDLTVARGNRHFPSLGNLYNAPRDYLGNRYEGIPVVLTEPLYLTNATGFALLEDDATHQAIAEAYVRAADRYFGR
ncbi:MAG TPA: N-acetylmuramoyl-L-alanine amidase [Thermomicrobiales bacterium]|nr:N-acetylmuramoyl-L-alanine amidase [Thermomicrobiales bacterium]